VKEHLKDKRDLVRQSSSGEVSHSDLDKELSMAMKELRDITKPP